ncbi:reverse transcriptase domain-containing protein, partial [Aeromonas sobria]|uniref:reverse transcriptase domain-containing protein n=1 Tax=Aeromonas sobria TaxID=646 RepID=UPI003F3F1764
VFSLDKNDLGRSRVLEHEIHLKTPEPVYVKQFRIPEAHREAIENQVKEWLKLGIVQPSRSRYNSPIFVVTKKDGGIRLVQDFRALNANTYIDKYSMRDVQECITEIGRAGSTIFSTIDLTSGFWQMVLKPQSRPLTAFTVIGMGQFEFVTSPMGLLGCPASFQRLMETVTKGLENIIVYIDDLFVHSHTHEQHRQQLKALFDRLAQHNLKINLKKCYFGQKNIEYLGFSLTEKGILPGTEKLKAVAMATPPDSIHTIRQFLGLCNFFRNHIKDFAIVSHPLVALTRKDSGWKGGALPPEALKSFKELKTMLCSNPIVDFPRKNRQYALITDAALGDDNHPGGLGAILTQIDKTGNFHVLAYASRKLQKHEKNYTPFLLEMQAAYWGMEHFSAYLKGTPFILYTDHKPMEKLGKVHTKTLYRIQEAMLYYNFEIVYKKGSEMPADFLSRNVITSISPQISTSDLILLQDNDPLISALKTFLSTGQLSPDKNIQEEVRFYAKDSFILDNILWRRLARHGFTPQSVIFLPRNLAQEIIKQFHGQWDTGHEGIAKTKERILLHYYWPGMDSDIKTFIEQCHKCQLRKKI